MLIGSVWLRLAKNIPTRLGMTEDDPEWFKIVQNGPDWSRMSQYGPIWAWAPYKGPNFTAFMAIWSSVFVFFNRNYELSNQKSKNDPKWIREPF